MEMYMSGFLFGLCIIMLTLIIGISEIVSKLKDIHHTLKDIRENPIERATYPIATGSLTEGVSSDYKAVGRINGWTGKVDE